MGPDVKLGKRLCVQAHGSQVSTCRGGLGLMGFIGMFVGSPRFGVLVFQIEGLGLLWVSLNHSHGFSYRVQNGFIGFSWFSL